MLMVQLFHDFHLTFDAFASVRLHQFGLLVDLYSDLLIECSVQAKSNHCIGTLANSFSNEIAV